MTSREEFVYLKPKNILKTIKSSNIVHERISPGLSVRGGKSTPQKPGHKNNLKVRFILRILFAFNSGQVIGF